MEYLSYVKSLQDDKPKLNSSHPKLKEGGFEYVVIKEGPLSNRDACNDFINSSDEELYGFDTPKKDKHDYILNLMKKIEAENSEEADLEKDVIDGIEFLSFVSERELMDYAKAQQDLRANASQSDDGLEILDDGTFSDISSNHAIVPTKTKDITRIKGWRNKHFAGINVCDDSGSSLRNDDDGFGDDFEMKSVQDESSEEVESVGYAASTTSHELNFKIDSPVIEDSNAVDNAEGFTFKNSNKSLSSLNSSMSQKPVASNSGKGTALDFSFDNFNMKGIFTSEKLSNMPAFADQASANKCVDSFLSPLTPQDKKSKQTFDSKLVYRSRIKQGFLERLAKKVSAESCETFAEDSVPSSLPNSKFEQGIRWHVPKEKLLSGNIYDVEVSVGSDSQLINSKSSNDTSTVNIDSKSSGKSTVDKGGESQLVIKRVESIDIAAFQSTTLEHYTTNLDKLHIDFTIPKLDAADNVTHEEIELPIQDSISKPQLKQKLDLKDDVRARTVAEKRKLLSELSLSQRSKRKQKLSFKMRANNELNNSKRVKRLRGRIEKNTQKAKLKEEVKPHDKKSHIIKELFDKQGVITYGREKTLKSAISRSLMSHYKSNLSCNADNAKSSSTSSSIGMVLNIGVFRPLFKEASDNIEKFEFDDNGNISAAYAAFASSAVQNSFDHPFTVTRILVPVVDETLKKIMYISTKSQKRNSPKNKLRFIHKNRKTLSDLNSLVVPEGKISEETKQFVEHNKIDNDVFSVVTEILNYVELREYFQNVDCNLDPDVPVPVEKESSNMALMKSTNKRKKTKLQRQIERLGGTFIAVQGDEANEENLAQISEENKNCLKESCKMGCVCYYRMLREEHCGQEACMFSCNCSPFARRQGYEIKSKIWLLPEVLRHCNESQSKLAPVEREYHQTVIMSKDKKITIETKHRKRERKIPSKYKDEILFDYRKGNDHEEDDCVIVGVEHEKTLKTKQHQESKESPECPKKRFSSPLSSFVETTFDNSTTIHDSAVNIRHCSVEIERSDIIEKMIAELNFTPGVHINSWHNIINPKKPKSSKIKSRNVARKKTGFQSSHSFDVLNFCSRTYGITEDYVLRNYLGKIRTKDFTLYSSLSHGIDSSRFIQPLNNIPIIKEDLVEISCTDNEDENEIEEKSPNDEERGLQIKFVRSLPPDLFENQDQIDQEENIEESNDNKCGNQSFAVPCINNARVNRSFPLGEKKRFVYASLPTTDNESKWWVVELDNEKFTDLVYYSEKRALSFPIIKKAVFDAEYNNTTVKFVLKNPTSPFQDKFGAYVVGGHKHLIFFGPYDLSESHGITAIKNDNEKFIHVPFTSKFSKSENFKSLGINMPPVKDNCYSVLKAVSAVWWYSTGKRGTLNNVAGNKCNQDKPILNSSLTSYHEDRSNSVEISTLKQAVTESDLPDTVGEIVDDITIEHDSVKLEPFDYEDSTYYNSVQEISTDSHVTNASIESESSQTVFESNTQKVEFESDQVITKNNSQGTSTGFQPPSFANRSLLKSNVAKMKTSPPCEIPPPLKPKLGFPKKRKRRSGPKFTKRRKKPTVIDKEKSFCRSLKKKIELLKSQEKVLSKKVERNERQALENISEIDFESDSSSLSDEDFYADNVPDQKDDVVVPVDEALKDQQLKRIVHKSSKVAPKSKEPNPGVPPNLIQKKPLEGPCPEKALLSLTPGIGYIPVVEFDPRRSILIIKDPSNPLLEHVFTDRSHAADWLNQYFASRFIFKPKFDMQWVMMTGSIIRLLQPLNKDIFKYKAKSLTIRPCGLELGQCRLMDQDTFVDWERRELSLLTEKIATSSSSNCATPRHKQKRRRQINLDQDYGVLKQNHNEMERMRRSELGVLMKELGDVVYLENKPNRMAKFSILVRAKSIIDAQKLLEEELRLKFKELKTKKDMLNDKLKSIFQDIVDHDEKKKALDICKFIRCSQFKLPDMSDSYMKLTVEKEDEIISKLSQDNQLWRLNKNISSGSMSMRSSSSSGSLGSVGSSSPDITNQLSAPRAKQPTEGVLIKSKLRSLAASRPDLHIYPASKDGGEIINLIDDDEDEIIEDEIIEIESDGEGEEVIFFPDPEAPAPEDSDVEIISSNFKLKRRRKKLKLPRPKRVKLPELNPQYPPSSCTVNSVGPPPPVTSKSPAFMAHLQLPRLQPGPEFVSVAEHDYQALSCVFSSGCSRTDPVPDKYQRRVQQQQFIPIHNFVNRIRPPINEVTPTVQRTLTSVAGFQQIKLKNMTPIGHIGLHEKLSNLRGKPVLLRKSIEGIQLTKIPLVQPPQHLTPLSATPVTITENLVSTNTSEKVSPDRGNTVTLYHPEEEISVTKTVQFANLNSVRLDMPSSSVLSGPKMRKPKEDGVPGSIKILLPKRS